MFGFKIFIFFVFLKILEATPLDDYVWAPDPNYNWAHMGDEYDFVGKMDNCTYKGYFINMTSQRWLSDADFASNSPAKSLWWHILVVIIPDTLRFKNNATLYVTGETMNYMPNSTIDGDLESGKVIACATGSVTGVLYQVPNENVVFSTDPYNISRTEDTALAFSWQMFLDNPSNPNFIIRFPMVKAALRGMDTIQAFVSQKRTDAKIDSFLVSGASKRGWVTWLVGAVDPVRVKAIAPIVMDAVNFVPVLKHTYQSYGAWSFVMLDFISNLHTPLTQRWDETNMAIMQQHVDPYNYFDRLTMPKMVIDGTMDEFMAPDDSHFWWDKLPEPKNFLLVPNADHFMAASFNLEIPYAIAAFGAANFLGKEVPSFTWELDKANGKITATIPNDISIKAVNAWYAYSCGFNHKDNSTRRDFRLLTLDNPCPCGMQISQFGYTMCQNNLAAWSSQQIQPKIINDQRVYEVSHQDFAPPSKNPKQWLAFMIEFKLVNEYGVFLNVTEEMKKKAKKPKTFFGDNIDDLTGDFDFTTEALVWPDEYPYSDCYMNSCGTDLV